MDFALVIFVGNQVVAKQRAQRRLVREDFDLGDSLHSLIFFFFGEAGHTYLITVTHTKTDFKEIHKCGLNNYL